MPLVSRARPFTDSQPVGCESVKGLSRETKVPQPCNLDGNSMNIQEENSAHYFRLQSERELTLD